MAILYKHTNLLAQSSHAVFDAVHEPGEITANSGIYHCLGCGKEATSVSGHPLPPQNHHQHNAQQGRVRWQLAVWG